MNRKTLGLCATLTLLALAFLWEQVQATRLGYEVGRARLALRAQRDKTSYLRLELERLQSPERLAETARIRLGMSAPEPESLIYLDNPVARTEPIASVSKPRPLRYAALFGSALNGPPGPEEEMSGPPPGGGAR